MVAEFWLDGRPYWSGIQIDETRISDPALRHARCAPARSRRSDRERYAGHDPGCGRLHRSQRTRDASRIAGKRTAVIRPSPSPSKLRRCSPPPRHAERHGEDRLPRYLRGNSGWLERADRRLDLRRRIRRSRAKLRSGWILYARSPSRARPMRVAARGFVPIKNRLRSASAARRRWAADQSGCAGAGALRPAGRRRSAHSEYREGDRFAAAARIAGGPYWYRYNGDGYGEHADGAPFDGAGIGRLWPLLTGERAHYELAAGRPQEARRLLAALEAAASTGGLLPEQIWDSEDVAATGAVSRPALGQRHAAGLGACRTYQAAAVAP